MTKANVQNWKSRIAFRALPLVIGCVVLFLFWNGRPAGTNAPEVDSPVALSSVAFDEIRETISYEEGEEIFSWGFQAPAGRVIEYRYNIDHNVELVLPKNPLEPEKGDVAPQQMNIRMQGILVSGAYHSFQDDRLLLGFQFPEIQLDLDQKMTAEDRQLLREEMKREVFASMTPQGRFERFWFPEGMRPQARNLVREIVLKSQVILPEEPAPTWETYEGDVTGLFRAKYTSRRGKVGAVEILELIREKDSYAAVNSMLIGGDGSSSTEISTRPFGRTTAILFLKEGFLRDLHRSGGLRAGGGSYFARVCKKTEAGLLYQRKYHDPARAALSAEEMRQRLSLFESASPFGLEEAAAQAEEKRIDRIEVLAQGRTVSGMVQNVLLPLFRQGRLKKGEAIRAREIMAAIFQLDDEAAREALSLVEGGALPMEVMGVLIGAFGSAGTPVAQEALVDLIQSESMEPGVRMSALVAMAEPKRPTVEAREALCSLVNPEDRRGLGSTVLLVLGAMTKRLVDAGDPASAELGAFLLQQEASFKAAGQEASFLNALGNAGSSKGFDTVVSYLEDPSERIRGKAVNALRHISHRGVTGHLAQALQDRSLSVQLFALKGLQVRSYESNSAKVVRDLVVSSPSSQVRKMGVLYFGKHRDQEGVLEVLSDISLQDPDKDVRAAAEKFLF